jgi:threonine dehydrogenase-like Zn-dependent dehydrogenase
LDAQLACVAAAVPLASLAGARALVVGCGADAQLVPHLLHAGAWQVLGVDCSAAAVAQAAKFHPHPGVCGNAGGARFWSGPLAELPAYHGPFTAAFFASSALGEVHQAREALTQATLLLSHGAWETAVGVHSARLRLAQAAGWSSRSRTSQTR